MKILTESPGRNTSLKDSGPPQSHLSDQQLIAGGLEGDRLAFDILFARYRPLLYRLALRILRNHEESEDAVQNCSLLAYCKLTTLKLEGAFHSWLVRILVNESIALLRKRKNFTGRVDSRRKQADTADVLDSLIHPSPDPEQTLANKQWTATVSRQLCRLGTLQRAAIILCGMDGYSSEEVGAMFSVAPSTVRARLFRARKRLLSALLRRKVSSPPNLTAVLHSRVNHAAKLV